MALVRFFVPQVRAFYLNGAAPPPPHRVGVYAVHRLRSPDRALTYAGALVAEPPLVPPVPPVVVVVASLREPLFPLLAQRAPNAYPVVQTRNGVYQLLVSAVSVALGVVDLPRRRLYALQTHFPKPRALALLVARVAVFPLFPDHLALFVPHHSALALLLRA